MKQIINGKLYDTDADEHIGLERLYGRFTMGVIFGDIYKNDKGEYYFVPINQKIGGVVLKREQLKKENQHLIKLLFGEKEEG